MLEVLIVFGIIFLFAMNVILASLNVDHHIKDRFSIVSKKTWEKIDKNHMESLKIGISIVEFGIMFIFGFPIFIYIIIRGMIKDIKKLKTLDE